MSLLGEGGGAKGQGQDYGPYKEITEKMMASLQGLTPRPGMVQAFTEIYRSASKEGTEVHLWGATNGSRSLAEKLFTSALGLSPSGGGADLHPGKTVGVWSCDEIRVAKPDPRVYAAVKEKVLAEAGVKSEREASLWFVASHSWDTDAAGRAG